MYKLVAPGKTQFGTLFLEIKYSQEDGKDRLSITGVEGPMKNGNCKGSCGQTLNALYNLNTLFDGWTKDKVKKLGKVWKKWHLNDMRAGCVHQRELGWKPLPYKFDPEKGRASVDPDDPVGKPCPECGYKYGTQWLWEPVPEKVVKFLEGLSETDLPYPWAT